LLGIDGKFMMTSPKCSNVIVDGVLFMRKEDVERIGRLKPEERVNLAVGMSDVCVRVCADGVRERLTFGKRREK